MGGEPGLALLTASFAVGEACQVPWMLAPRGRAAYARWRPLLYLLSCLHVSAVLLALGLWSRRSVLLLHGGSALALAPVMAAANAGLIQGYYWLYSRLPATYVALAAPAAALLPAAAGPQLCTRLLGDERSHEALATLHRSIAAFNTASVPWHAALVAERPPPPQQACLEVNMYILLLLAVALPLVAGRHLEDGSDAQPEAGSARQARQGDSDAERRQEGPPPTARPGLASLPIQLYFASCTTWCCSSLASLVWPGSAAVGGTPAT